ncbi:MAG: hypothetical protein RIT46_684, partial [Pseudomonadota bacterium]
MNQNRLYANIAILVVALVVIANTLFVVDQRE